MIPFPSPHNYCCLVFASVLGLCLEIPQMTAPPRFWAPRSQPYHGTSARYPSSNSPHTGRCDVLRGPYLPELGSRPPSWSSVVVVVGVPSPQSSQVCCCRSLVSLPQPNGARELHAKRLPVVWLCINIAPIIYLDSYDLPPPAALHVSQLEYICLIFQDGRCEP